MTVSCLYTTVINTGATRPIGYLGKHGKRLAAGEQFSEPGHLPDKLRDNLRKFHSLERDLDEGRLAILSTPSVHLYDDTLDVAKVLELNNNSLSAQDPCWGSYVSE
jgi:hypothetical protein